MAKKVYTKGLYSDILLFNNFLELLYMANNLKMVIELLQKATAELKQSNDEAEARELAELANYNKTKELNDEQ